MSHAEEDTEWNDVLRAKGIIDTPKPRGEMEMSLEALEALVDETVAAQNAEKDLSTKTLVELDEMEDELLDDERMLESYRRQRMAELHSLASKEIYGSVVEISKPEYAAQVSEASARDGTTVIVHLYDNSLPACKRINGILNVLAQKHRSVKFLKIVATRCIEGYPEKNIPTLLVYANGDLKGQLVGIEALGGLETTVLRVQELLSSRQFGALLPPSKESLEKDSGFKLTRTAEASIRQSAKHDSDDDEDPYA